MKKIHGVTHGHWETGTEGVIWMVDRRLTRWQRILDRFIRAPHHAAAAVRALFGTRLPEWRRRRERGQPAPFLWELRTWWRYDLRPIFFYSPYDDLVDVEEGDRLTVFMPDGETVAFGGVIDPDFEVGFQPYPMNPDLGQQCSCGFWVHWIQRGWDPDMWGRLFLRDQLKPEFGGGPALKAVLIKGEGAAAEGQEDDLDED